MNSTQRKLIIVLFALQLFVLLTAKAYYDPSTRTFLSRDPLREGGGANHYAYCFNMPLQYVDPTGGRPQPVGTKMDNGQAKVLWEDWSSPFGPIFGGTKTWLQDPTPEQLARLFRFENGSLRVADYSERHDVFWKQYGPASKISAANAAATSSAVAKMTYGPLALVSGWGALAEGGVTVGTLLFAGHEGYAGGSMLLGLFTGEDYEISPEGLIASSIGASDRTVGIIDASLTFGSPFFLARGGRGVPPKIPDSFSYSDVEKAIVRLKMKGISPAQQNKPLDYEQIVKLATAMKEGSFDPTLGPRIGDLPILDNFSRVIVSGHHRIIAAEMAGFPLNIEGISARNPIIPAGVWEDLMPIYRPWLNKK